MAMASLKRYGAGGIGYDKDIASPEQIRNIFKPQKAVPFNLENVKDRSIQNAIWQMNAPAVNPALGQYSVQLANLLHMTSFTGDFSEGQMQSVDIDTLGGQQLAHAKEEEKKGGITTMKVDHRMGCAEIISDLGRRHMKIPRFYASSQDRHGATKGKWISGAMLPESIKFDNVPDSEIPQNNFEKRMAIKEAVKEAGGLLGVAQAAALDPKNTAWYFEQCGVRIPSLDQEGVVIVCLARLDEIKRLSEIYGHPEEIIASLSKPPIEQETGHLFKADFLSEVLDDDEVDTWNPLAKATVVTLIERHRELHDAAGLRAAMRAQNAQMALAGQAAQQQAAIQQPLIDQQNAANQDAQAAEMLGGLAERHAEEEQKEMQHERDLEKADIEGERGRAGEAEAHERSKEDAAVQHDRTKELEQIKAAAAQKKAAKSGKGK
jgi:hypothetical protein